MDETVGRIRDLLEQAGITQGELGNRIGLAPSKMSRSMHGTRRFSLADISAIAAELDVSVDWLLTGQEPPLASAARRAPGASAERAVRRARQFATQRSDLTTLGYSSIWRGLSRDVPLSGRNVDQGTELAQEALADVNGHGHDVLRDDLADVVEVTFGADVAVIDVGVGVDGVAVSDSEARVLVVGTSAVPARQRFTIAHELGHLLAGDDQQVHIDRDVYADESRRGGGEMRANAFAAAFLMPESYLREQLADAADDDTFCRVACDLRVSPSALAYRMINLDLTDSQTAERRRQITIRQAAERAGQTGRFGVATATAAKERLPQRLIHDTFDAYRKGKTTLRPYANLLGVDVHWLRDQLESGDHEVA